MTSNPLSNNADLTHLADQIKAWGRDLGFDDVGITDVDLQAHEQHLNRWLAAGMHGEMAYMRRHGNKRSRPEELVPGTCRVISVRLDYAPDDIQQAEQVLENPEIAYISRYALGRDYHKVIRKKLQTLATKVEGEIGAFGYRVFTDSAPVLEKALAEKAGLGWIGKHSNLLHSKRGSWFFLGEIYIDLQIPIDKPATNHCGTCTSCIDCCPTQAIVAPYQVDARRCISYLTIELRDSIPEEFRPLIGNRIYGCDDCQIVCPWNKFAQPSREVDFSPRSQITDRELLTVFGWTEKEFMKHTEGSAIRRIGYACWLRNIAVALGNAPFDNAIVTALKNRLPHVNDMVAEHIEWAIKEQRIKSESQLPN